MKKSHLIFVYGTLKFGFANHVHYLGNSKLVSKSAVTCKRNFTMSDLGIPFVAVANPKVPQRLKGFVAGELYNVTEEELVSLDRLESNGVLYKRTPIEVYDLSSKKQFKKTAEVYLSVNSHLSTDFMMIPADDNVLQWNKGKLG